MELIILPRCWFFEGSPTKFAPLQKLINKSYDKNRYKYDIIKSLRIKTPTSLLSDLCFTNDDEISIFMLLGPQDKFEKCSSSFVRDFAESSNLQDSFNCDIPQHLLDEFDFDESSELTVSIANPEFQLDNKDLARILGTVGIRSYHSKEKTEPTIKELELTAFTSFMRNLGPKLLDLVVNKYLLDLYSQYDTILLHADVIREHNLVEYYSQKCGFNQEDREDVLIKSLGNFTGNEFLEKGIVSSKDFHIAFICKEICAVTERSEVTSS